MAATAKIITHALTAVIGYGVGADQARAARAKTQATLAQLERRNANLLDVRRDRDAVRAQLADTQSNLEASGRCVQGARANLRDAETRIAELEAAQTAISTEAPAAAAVGMWCYLVARLA